MTPNEMDAAVAALRCQDESLSQEAALQWVDAVMRRAGAMALELDEMRDYAFTSPDGRARLVDTYVSAAIEVASQGIAVRVVPEREVEQSEEEPEEPESLCGEGCDEDTVATGVQMCVLCPARRFDLPPPLPFADNACGHRCEAKMVAAGMPICRRCRLNPSLK